MAEQVRYKVKFKIRLQCPFVETLSRRRQVDKIKFLFARNGQNVCISMSRNGQLRDNMMDLRNRQNPKLSQIIRT